jgi:hypothetical protein
MKKPELTKMTLPNQPTVTWKLAPTGELPQGIKLKKKERRVIPIKDVPNQYNNIWTYQGNRNDWIGPEDAWGEWYKPYFEIVELGTRLRIPVLAYKGTAEELKEFVQPNSLRNMFLPKDKQNPASTWAINQYQGDALNLTFIGFCNLTKL